jgi:hypothetical protein
VHRAPPALVPQRPASWRRSKLWRKREKRFDVVALCITYGCEAAFGGNKSAARFGMNLASNVGLLDANASDKLKAPVRPEKVHLMMDVGLRDE